MAKSGLTRAHANKKIREEALREQLRAKGLVQHVIEISEKLQNLDNILDQTEVTRLRAAAELKLKLVSKYLPDLKSVEHSGGIEHRSPEQLTDDELAAIATGSGTSTNTEKASQKDIH